MSPGAFSSWTCCISYQGIHNRRAHQSFFLYKIEVMSPGAFFSWKCCISYQGIHNRRAHQSFFLYKIEVMSPGAFFSWTCCISYQGIHNRRAHQSFFCTKLKWCHQEFSLVAVQNIRDMYTFLSTSRGTFEQINKPHQEPFCCLRIRDAHEHVSIFFLCHAGSCPIFLLNIWLDWWNLQHVLY